MPNVQLDLESGITKRFGDGIERTEDIRENTLVN